MKQPSWSNLLSYETNSMNSEEIIKATYDYALKLNEFKYKNRIIAKDVHDEVRMKIEKSVEFLDRLDALEKMPEHVKQNELATIKNEVDLINRHSIVVKMN